MCMKKESDINGLPTNNEYEEFLAESKIDQRTAILAVVVFFLPMGACAVVTLLNGGF